MSNGSERSIAKVLTDLANAVYLRIYLCDNANSYPKRGENWIQGLSFFLRGYAFERQGASPEYAPLACAALMSATPTGNSLQVPNPQLSNQCWERFCELGGYQPDARGANRKMNPLNPEDKRDAIAICRCLQEHDYNIYSFARAKIESNEIQQAHTKIDTIRGIGEKIASFFLRDVALDRGIDVRSLKHQELLQPIDIWVRRAAEILSNNQKARTSDATAREEMVKIAKNADCCALRLNAGAWYFGSQVIGSHQGLRDSLKDVASVEEAIQRHAENLEREACALHALTRDGPPSKKVE